MRGKSAGQSANESQPLNELLSIHNVCTHRSHSVDCGPNKYVCSLSINLSSPLSESFFTCAWIKTKHNFSLIHVIAAPLPFAHYLDHMGTISTVYLSHDSITLLCVQQSSHCPCWEQETMAGSLSLHTHRIRKSIRTSGRKTTQISPRTQRQPQLKCLEETQRMWQESTNKQLEAWDTNRKVENEWK